MERANRRHRREDTRAAAGLGRDHPCGAWPGLQYFERRSVPGALALAADCRLFRCGVERAAYRWNASARASDERCRATLAGTCGEAWTSGTGCEPACLLVAYGRCPGPPGGMRKRHDREPGARLLRLPVHTRFFF